MKGFEVTALVENYDDATCEAMMECSECGPLGICPRSESDKVAIEHLASHGIPIPPEWDPNGDS